MSLIMADLDLLRDINNTYGHLAGDAVLARHRRGLPRAAARLRRPGPLRRRGVLDPAPGDAAARRRSRSPSASAARSPRASSRSRRRASRSAPRSRSASPASRATAATRTSSCTRPTSPSTARSSRAATASLDASDEPLLAQPEQPRAAPRGRCPADEVEPVRAAAAGAPRSSPEVERRTAAAAHARWAALLLGAARASPCSSASSGVPASPSASSAADPRPLARTSSACVAIVALVGARPGALARGRARPGTISVTAVGALAGAAIIGPRAALVARAHDGRGRVERAPAQRLPPAALQRRRAHARHARRGRDVFAIALRRAGRDAALDRHRPRRRLRLLRRSTRACSRSRSRSRAARAPWRVWRERFRWLLPHYLVYGFVAGVIYEAYRPIGVWALVRLRAAAAS